MKTRAAKVAEAQRLRGEGLLMREIAERMGAAVSTVDGWLNDPDLAKLRARKDSYRGECVDCGAPTDGSNGRDATPKRCDPCGRVWRHENRYWTPEAIIGCIQAWADEHGGIPPAATDWNPNHAIKLGRPEKAAKFWRDGCWPAVSQVQREFGSWNVAIQVAGFASRATSTYGRDGEDMALCREIAERYEAGESSADLAAEYECSGTAIIYRARKGGARIRTAREGVVLAWERRREAVAA